MSYRRPSTGLLRPPVARGTRLGFTLIELLVVIVIVGVLLAAVTLAAGGSATRELQNAAERSQRLIQLACERAVLSGRDLGFAPTRDGLRFGYYEIEGWRPLEADPGDELRPRPWGNGVEVEAERDGDRLVLDAEAPVEPPYACLASGELTPLRLRFRRGDVAEHWVLDGALDGRLTLARRDHAR